MASLLYPAAFIVLLWLIKAIELTFDLEFYSLGIYPQTTGGIKGIVLAPLIHGSISHLASNALPLLVLGTALFYFYRPVAFRVVVLGMLITGLWVWIIARPSYHIGASGIVYSLAAFLFVSGIIRRHPRLMALSLLVAFLYGSMVWGIFPLRQQISWESHLMGMVSGIVLALFFKGHGPQRPLYSWEREELEGTDEEEDENADDRVHDDRDDTGSGTSLIYHYTRQRKSRRDYGKRIR